MKLEPDPMTCSCDYVSLLSRPTGDEKVVRVWRACLHGISVPIVVAGQVNGEVLLKGMFATCVDAWLDEVRSDRTPHDNIYIMELDGGAMVALQGPESPSRAMPYVMWGLCPERSDRLGDTAISAQEAGKGIVFHECLDIETWIIHEIMSER